MGIVVGREVNARALRSLPLTAAAFERGELSYSKVRVLTRVATTDGEGDLVDLARTSTAAQLDKIVRATVTAMTDPKDSLPCTPIGANVRIDFQAPPASRLNS